jgi:DNA-binding beta-propeller fold protein YncE
MRPERFRRFPHRAPALLASLVALLGACDSGADADAQAAVTGGGAGGAPIFTIDPSWPSPLPNDWIIGSVTGVFVDAQDHVWVTHLVETLTEEEIAAAQEPPIATCCLPAPSVIELDAEGNVVQAWGDASQDISVYPRNPHGIFVDHEGFVWIGTYQHHRVQKFTRGGELVMTIGRYDETGGSNDTTLLGGPAGIWVDPGTNEVFVADGYRNRRVIVFDGETGAYRRHWGANGQPPVDGGGGGRGGRGEGAREAGAGAQPASASPAPQQFSTVHGIVGSRDGLIYVADRRGNRVQVFRQSGEFVAERAVAPATLASGSAFVPVLSVDPEQRWLYLADGTNHKVWILRRSDLEIVGDFGKGGHFVGQFLRPHGMSVDSRGNLYVGEASTGRRVQRFTLSGGG